MAEGEINLKHTWPADGACLFGPWMQKTGLPKPTDYRNCVHPACNQVEYRDGAKA